MASSHDGGDGLELQYDERTRRRGRRERNRLVSGRKGGRMNERWRREGGEDRGGNTHGEAEWIIADRQDGQADNGRGPLPRQRREFCICISVAFAVICRWLSE